jgi:hypothetical protein
MCGYGRGFGFRGASPPWPYVGRGRGGLPRCWYPGLLGAPTYGYEPITKEQELSFLKNQAELIREELNQIEARIKELESGK